MSQEKAVQQNAPALRCEHCEAVPERGEGNALRCACGSLLARYVEGRLELKCRRCKRTVLVPFEPAEADVETA